MRAVIPLAGLALSACAPSTPLDLIPREDLLMIEAADRLERQNPMAIRSPAPPRDLDAEYRAALIAAGIEPFAPEAPEAPADRPAAMAAPQAIQPTAPAPAPSAVTADPPQPATGPISVEAMLARVREQAQPAP
jgi:hypothetical protein